MTSTLASERDTSPAEKTSAAAPPAAERMQSLDILRGFDMFWISGGEGLFVALAKATGWAWAVAFAAQLEHVPWAGCHFYDLIFPTFLFISGVTLPLVVTRRIARGESRRVILGRLALRAVLLSLLGYLYNQKGVTFDLHAIRFTSVLGRIGVAGFAAGVIVMFARPRAQFFWIAGLLLGYWALLALVPAPDQPGPSYEQGKNIVDWLDRHLMPGKLMSGNHDAIGWCSTPPAVATALLGALAGAWLLAAGAAWRKVLGLIGAGLVLVALGWAWSLRFPIIKHIWSSSYVLFAGGWSCLALGVFYGIVDGLRWRRWGFLFLLIGMNPLVLYVLRGTGLISFSAAGKFFFGFAYAGVKSPWLGLYQELATLAVEFLFLYWLYRRKIFLRV